MRVDFESTLLSLLRPLMPLGAEAPKLLDVAVQLGAGGHGNAGHASVDPLLAWLVGNLEGGSEPAPRARQSLTQHNRRVERHVDAICVYEGQRLENGLGERWTLEGAADFQNIAIAERADGATTLLDAQARRLVHVSVDENGHDTIWKWLRTERPDLSDARRSMTALEATSLHGCLMLIVLGVGGLFTAFLHWVDAASWAVIASGVTTSALALFSLSYAVKRLVKRPVVIQLVSGTARTAFAPDAELESAVN
jgi:hypothetical protein